MLLVNNLTTGLFDLYNFPSNTPSTSLSVSSRRKLVKPALFAERHSKTALFGSDDGSVYVYDVESGDLLQRLQQENGMSMPISLYSQ